MAAMERFMDFTFVAAQRLTGVGEAHKAAKLHGHTFELRVTVAGTPDVETGWLMDPADLKAEVNGVLAGIDHTFLNDLPGLENPSTERLTRHIATKLTERLPGLAKVELWENRDVGVSLDLGACTP